MTAGGNASLPSMRIAIIGDIHDYALGIWPWELLGKTLAGQANLWLNRRKRFDRSLIGPTVQRVLETKPDVILFSGDLTTTSRPREFRSVAKRLHPLFEAHDCVVVAGNHDRYTFTAQRTRRFERFFPGRVPVVLPFTRPLIGSWRLIAVDSAVPRLLDSKGSIGNRQRQHVESLLRSISGDEGVIVLVHYPFGKPPQLPPMKPGHRLIDESGWRHTLAQCAGRMIIVHGHVHCPWLWSPEIECSETRRPMRLLDVNAGSPTLISGRLGGWPRGQGFWTLDLSANAGEPFTLTHHVMGAGEAPVGVDPELPAEGPTAGDAAQWVMRSIRMSL